MHTAVLPAMSDQHPTYALSWHQCRDKVQHVIKKHFSRLLEINLDLLQPYIEARKLLETGESDQVWDTRRDCTERKRQLLQFVCRKGGFNHRNGLHGLEVLIECLRASGKDCRYPYHTDLSRDLIADLQGRL